jgi:hypothetical protein
MTTSQKLTAWFGGAALNALMFLNLVIAGVAMFLGKLIGALGGGSGRAIAFAIGFTALAALQAVAAYVLKWGKRHWFVPAVLGLTLAVQLAFDVKARSVNVLDAIIVACAAFAGYAWWQLPRSLARKTDELGLGAW